MQHPTRESSKEVLIGTVLLLVLAITRSGITRSHFGTEINLPDASWAMFLLVGYLTGSRWWPLVFMLACVSVDYFVIASGVSADCFTPAYPFLIPAYLSLWASGRWLQGHTRLLLLNASLAVLIGTGACFVISNVGFYLAGGYLAQMSAILYAQAVAGYWPHYLLHTAIYSGTGVLTHYIISYRFASSPDESQDR